VPSLKSQEGGGGAAVGGGGVMFSPGMEHVDSTIAKSVFIKNRQIILEGGGRGGGGGGEERGGWGFRRGG
jgi:hypothetical protein